MMKGATALATSSSTTATSTTTTSAISTAAVALPTAATRAEDRSRKQWLGKALKSIVFLKRAWNERQWGMFRF